MRLFGAVEPPWWDDKPLAIVGAGASLKGFDFRRLDRPDLRVLAVKTAWEDLPFAAACFGLDLPWIARDAHRLRELSRRMPLYLAVPERGPDVDRLPEIPDAIWLRQTRIMGAMSERPDTIETGGNSGFGALNLAYLKRARAVYLFGFDYGGAPHDPSRYAHQQPGHNARYWPKWAANFLLALPQARAAGMAVVNASPSSVVTAFPRCDHETIFANLDRLGPAPH